MKNIVIIGAGGFGREIQWLLERINNFKEEKTWNLIGFIDDIVPVGTDVNGVKVIGNLDYLRTLDSPINVTCAIGASQIRKQIITSLKNNSNLNFPNLIDPSVTFSNSIEWGQGNIICANNILTVNIKCGDFCIINLSCTIGHDAILQDFVTIYPGVNVSGCTNIAKGTEIGTGSQIIQGISIGADTIIGAGSTVIRDIPSGVTAVGNPCRVLKKHEHEK